jgi:hypothetical protein
MYFEVRDYDGVQILEVEPRTTTTDQMEEL